MSTINKPNEFTGLTEAVATEVNDNFDTIYNEFNGSIDENNINLTKAEFKAALLETLKTVDGTGSGLDTDLLDGKEYSEISTEIDTAEAVAKAYTDANVPQGLISMWSGSIVSIPSTWALCNGSNGTPDLRDRFVVGAGSSYSVGDTGGVNSVTLTEAQLPSHSHGDGSLATNTTGSHYHSFSDTSSSAGSHGHSGSTNTTGNHRHGINVHDNGSALTRVSRHEAHDYAGIAYSLYAGDHSHSLSINSNGSHTHYVSGNTSSSGSHSHTISGSTANAGSDNTHNNLQPYITVYMWKRIA